MDLALGGSLLWGLFTAASLIVGAVIAMWVQLSQRTVGLVLGFGSGVLISAVAFDLVDEAHDIASGQGGLAIGLAAGCLVFYAGDTLINRMGPTSEDAEEGGGPLAIVLGATLDGIPESAVVGLTLSLSGQVGVAYVVAVFLSNVPEGLAATRGLLRDGWSAARVLRLWTIVVVACGIASMAGYTLLDGASDSTVAFVLAFAGGGILTMLGSDMVPQAHEHGGELTGVVTTLGFGLAFAVHVMA